MIAALALVVVAATPDRLAELEKKLEVSPLSCAAGERAWRGVFGPSFRPPCAITLRDRAGAQTLELHLAGRRVEQAIEAAKSVEKLEKLERLADVTLSGADGMTARGSTCTGSFMAWSPMRGPQHDFLIELVNLGRTVSDEGAMFAAEGLVEYLSNEFVGSDDHGTPRVLRMLGASSNHKDAFRALLAGVPKDADVIFDLRNFSGAGTMFKPDFVAFDTRKGRTVWVADAEYLSKLLGVKRAHIVKTMDEARERLRGKK